MFRKFLFAAAASLAALATAPAEAGPWYYYDGYYPIQPAPVYALPYGFPFTPYTDVTVAVPVITYAPARVRIYTVPQAPPYYNVPPYAVYAPY